MVVHKGIHVLLFTGGEFFVNPSIFRIFSFPF
jgi:hypothetical protein